MKAKCPACHQDQKLSFNDLMNEWLCPHCFCRFRLEEPGRTFLRNFRMIWIAGVLFLYALLERIFQNNVLLLLFILFFIALDPFQLKIRLIGPFVPLKAVKVEKKGTEHEKNI